MADLLDELANHLPEGPHILAAITAIEASTRRVKELEEAVIAFGGPWAAQWAREHDLPDKHLHPKHYDLLASCGARMADFVRSQEGL